MARRCPILGIGPIRGSTISRRGKPKKQGGVGVRITKVNKRWFYPNLQRIKVIVDGTVKYIRVSTKAIKKGLVVKAPKRNWKPVQTSGR